MAIHCQCFDKFVLQKYTKLNNHNGGFFFEEAIKNILDFSRIY